MIVDKQEALRYEQGSTNLVMSYFNRIFFKYAMWRFERKYKRHLEFEQMMRKRLMPTMVRFGGEYNSNEQTK